MEGLTKLYLGDFNNLSQEKQPDGSVIITLTKHSENKIYRFRVKDLYGKGEEVLEYEETEVKQLEHIKKRFKEMKWTH